MELEASGLGIIPEAPKKKKSKNDDCSASSFLNSQAN